MQIRLVDTGWNKEISDAISHEGDELCIICPFIKTKALARLLVNKPRNVRAITRFNLSDCANGVNDLAAMRRLLSGGGQVRGVRNLHAKLYIFGSNRAIVTSANLTTAALEQNHELGIVTQDPTLIAECQSDLDKLWSIAGNDLEVTQVNEWEDLVTEHLAQGGVPTRTSGLGDFGTNAGLSAERAVQMPERFTDASQAYVKFLGEGHKRKPLSYPVIEEVERAGCHWAVAYPQSKRPTSVRDDAVMFIARLTDEPNDMRVIGRAIAMRHVRERDEASSEDIARRDWKSHWSQYIRVHHAEFVAGTLGNGVSLNELMEALGSMSFASTKRNANLGTGNTDPRRAYLQQAAVELSEEGLAWLSQKLQMSIDMHGIIPQATLDELDWPTVDWRNTRLNAYDGVLMAMHALGGERTIGEVSKWIREQKIGDWKDVGATMFDAAFPPAPSSKYKPEDCFLERTERGVYALRADWRAEDVVKE